MEATALSIGLSMNLGKTRTILKDILKDMSKNVIEAFFWRRELDKTILILSIMQFKFQNIIYKILEINNHVSILCNYMDNLYMKLENVVLKIWDMEIALRRIKEIFVGLYPVIEILIGNFSGVFMVIALLKKMTQQVMQSIINIFSQKILISIDFEKKTESSNFSSILSNILKHKNTLNDVLGEVVKEKGNWAKAIGNWTETFIGSETLEYLREYTRLKMPISNWKNAYKAISNLFNAGLSFHEIGFGLDFMGKRIGGFGGQIMQLAGSIFNVMGFLAANPVIFGLIALVAVIALIFIYWDELCAFFSETFAYIGEWVDFIIEIFNEWEGYIMVFAPVLWLIMQPFKALRQFIKEFDFTTFINNSKESINQFILSIKSAFVREFPRLSKLLRINETSVPFDVNHNVKQDSAAGKTLASSETTKAKTKIENQQAEFHSPESAARKISEETKNSTAPNSAIGYNQGAQNGVSNIVVEGTAQIVTHSQMAQGVTYEETGTNSDFYNIDTIGSANSPFDAITTKGQEIVIELQAIKEKINEVANRPLNVDANLILDGREIASSVKRWWEGEDRRDGVVA